MKGVLAPRTLLDIFGEPHDRDMRIRRHAESIRLPYDQIIVTSPAGVPYLVPEVVLPLKAKPADPRTRPTSPVSCPC